MANTIQILQDLITATKRYENKVEGSPTTIAAVRMLSMSLQRVSSIAGMKWVEIDEKQNLWRVSADRMKNGNEHLVPRTVPMNDLLDSMRKLHFNQDFVFPSPRGGQGHLNPSSINQYLGKIGYRAHDIRAMSLAVSQEVLGFSAKLIQLQLAHSIGDKMSQADPKSMCMEERRKLLIEWCQTLLGQGLEL